MITQRLQPSLPKGLGLILGGQWPCGDIKLDFFKWRAMPEIDTNRACCKPLINIANITIVHIVFGRERMVNAQQAPARMGGIALLPEGMDKGFIAAYPNGLHKVRLLPMQKQVFAIVSKTVLVAAQYRLVGVSWHQPREGENAFLH